jgi:hypothetical protein
VPDSRDRELRVVTKKHHYVPQFILRYFANANRKLIVSPISRPVEYGATVKNIGHRNQGHSLYFPGRPTDHDTLEAAMSDLEGAASGVIGRLSSSTRNELIADDKETLTFFIALQWSRHRFLLEALRRDMLLRESVEESSVEYEYLTKSLGLNQIYTGVLAPWAALQSGDWSSQKDIFSSVGSWLVGMNWNLIRTRSDALIVSDNLVCLSDVAAGKEHAAPSKAWTLHGLGVGFANCRRVTVPLTPRLAVIIAPSAADTIGLRADHINRFTVANSREFIAYRPGWPAEQPVRYRNVEKHLLTQRFIIAGALGSVRMP